MMIFVCLFVEGLFSPYW